MVAVVVGVVVVVQIAPTAPSALGAHLSAPAGKEKENFRWQVLCMLSVKLKSSVAGKKLCEWGRRARPVVL
jgi:hypothetical protein